MDFSNLKTVTNSVDSMFPLEKLSAMLPDLPFDALENMLADFASAFTQGNRLLTLHIGDGKTYKDRLIPQSIEGSEALSVCHRYEVICLSPDAFIPLNGLLGQGAQVDILTSGGNIPGLALGESELEQVTRCGLITEAQALSSDGGFAKYKLIIESPLALLRHRWTSRVFQDVSVPEIVKTILDEHIAANRAISGILKVKFDLIKQYPPRSYCLQYRETDLAFIERLLFEEGIGYYHEHESGDVAMCRFVAFDDPWGLPQAAQETVRFHRADATEAEDSLTEWTESRQVGPGRATLTSYDYKNVRITEADCESRTAEENKYPQGKNPLAEASLEDFDTQTLYYGRDYEDHSRYAGLRQNVHDRQKGSFSAQGNLRCLVAGEWFRLSGHPNYTLLSPEEREFVACKVHFSAHNNLPQRLSQHLVSPLLRTGGEEESPKPYWVKISTRKRGLPLTPQYAHTHHAKPIALGIQTATVTGPGGEEVYTDEMGRVKIQFHWQRPKEHPEFGANFDERSSCWVRIAYPGAGSAWGHQSIPRIGQEVLVDFLEGDIDRPIIAGVIHNGAQPNPWFSGTGSLPANRTLTGIKTKEFHGNQYNELLFDDTQNEVRTKLSSEHGKTQLNQGYLTHPRQDGKAEPRGDGFELRTDRHGALRASEGLLITTEGKPGASGKQIDREQAQALLDAARQVTQTLGEAAAHQNADSAEIGPETRDEEGNAAGKASSGHIDHMVEAVRSWEAGTNTDPKHKTASDQPGRQPVILMSGAEGIGLTTPQEMVLTSGQNLYTVSQRDTQGTTARRWIHNVGKKISLFVHGIKDKVNLKIIAAKGHVQLQAQSGDVEIVGDQNVRIHANKGKLVAAAGEEILLNCAGAYIRLKGGGIDIHAPGKISMKAANFSFSGPASMNPSHPSFPESNLKELFSVTVDQAPGNVNFSWRGMPYKLYANGGLLKEGVMDDSGRILVEHNVSVSAYKLEMANGVIYNIPATNQYTHRAAGEAANTGFNKHRSNEGETARTAVQAIIEGSTNER